MIFLWDEVKDYTLVSKYDPILIGAGEAGLERVLDDDEGSVIIDYNFSKTKSSRFRYPHL